MLGSLCALVCACAHSQAPEPSPSRATSGQASSSQLHSGITIRSFSEIDPVIAVAEHSGIAYAASGTKLWRFEPLATAIACPATRARKPIVALTAHPAQGLWLATADGLVARLREGGWKVMPKPPVSSITTLASSAEGVWAGGAGLARWDGRSWRRIALAALPVTSLQPAAGPRLWVGTQAGGIFLVDRQKSQAVPVDKGDDVTLRQVKALAVTPAGGLVAVGRDGRGGALLVTFDGRYWVGHRMGGPLPLDWIGRAGAGLLVGSGEQVFALAPLRGAARQAPPRDAMVLSATPERASPPDYPHEQYALRPENLRVPGPTAVSDEGHDLLVATRTLGVARISPRRMIWLRPATLVSGERRFKMGCSGDECYLAVAGRSVRFDGSSFRNEGPSGLNPADYVHAFVPLKEGPLWVLHGPAAPRAVERPPPVAASMPARPTETSATGAASAPAVPLRLYETKIVLSELEGAEVKALHDLTFSAEHGHVQVAFARQSPRGELWMGLRVAQKGGESLPWGVAVVQDGQLIAHHRTSLLPGETHMAVRLPVPDDVRDVAFGSDGAVWLATASGVCRLHAAQLVLYSENDGLEGEITYAVGWSAKGEILAGTLGGLGRFDGSSWRFDLGPAHARATRALLSDGSTLWAGTAAGVVIRGGRRVDVISRSDGLIADGVLDLHRAADDTLWVLTEEGVSIVEEDQG